MPQDMCSGRNESFCPCTTVGTFWYCPLMQESCTLHRSSACWALLFAEVVVSVLLTSSQRSPVDSVSSSQNRFHFPARRSREAAKVFQTTVALACELPLAGQSPRKGLSSRHAKLPCQGAQRVLLIILREHLIGPGVCGVQGECLLLRQQNISTNVNSANHDASEVLHGISILSTCS